MNCARWSLCVEHVIAMFNCKEANIALNIRVWIHVGDKIDTVVRHKVMRIEVAIADTSHHAAVVADQPNRNLGFSITFGVKTSTTILD